MKHTLLTIIGSAPLILPLCLNAQTYTSFGQFFNNDNGSFTDSESTLYNWNAATANAVALTTVNISAGNTKPGPYTPAAGEVTLGRGFMFNLPAVNNASEQPGASLMYTTHLGISTDLQNNPQPDWFMDGPALSLAGRMVDQIGSITVRTNAATAGITAHIGLQLDGSNWVFAATPLTLGTAWGYYSITDLTTLTWVTGVFNGVALDADPSDNATTSLSGAETVSGYALYAITGTLGGNAARVRMDEIVVSAVPEPGTYALLFGLLAAAMIILRRRQR